jgi:hypothetical protein
LKSNAGFYFQHSLSYLAESEDAESLEYTTMRNITLLGANFGKSGNWVIGQSIMSWSRETTNAAMTGESSISLLELGPRVQYFFNDGKNFYVSGVYNFYAKGDRQVNGAAEEEIEGTSFLISSGIQLKVSKKFYFGLSYNYHTLSISKTASGSTTSDVSQSYTYTFPSLEFSFRFK